MNQQWINRSHPPNLMNAVILLYINAVFAVLFGGLRGGFNELQLINIIGIAAGYGIANDKKWGYYLGVAVAIVPLLLTLAYFLQLGPLRLVPGLGTLFQVVLFALLMMKDSKEYVRIWFK